MDDIELVPIVKSPLDTGPLSGVTILLVEDSKQASDTFRLMCLRSGARMRRVDSLLTARQHLKLYQPDVAIVDLGLPDGSGRGLIKELAKRSWRRRPVVVGLSGDPDGRVQARQAGAHGFIAKPVAGIRQFQQRIISVLPRRRRLRTRSPECAPILPDPLAYREDLEKAAIHLNQRRNIGYVAQFLGSIARDTRDFRLEAAARALNAAYRRGTLPDHRVEDLDNLMRDRLMKLPEI